MFSTDAIDARSGGLSDMPEHFQNFLRAPRAPHAWSRVAAVFWRVARQPSSGSAGLLRGQS
eukprot:104335-Pyramimonas_sp.AAC.1